MSLSRFFIDRPVFAWVIAVVVMLAGGIAAFSLPIEQYPTIAPPAVAINATYPGADSESPAELIEEGQTFEAGIIEAVQDAPDADRGDIRTREVPEDDVPLEYDDDGKPDTGD